MTLFLCSQCMSILLYQISLSPIFQLCIFQVPVLPAKSLATVDVYNPMFGHFSFQVMYMASCLPGVLPTGKNLHHHCPTGTSPRPPWRCSCPRLGGASKSCKAICTPGLSHLFLLIGHREVLVGPQVQAERWCAVGVGTVEVGCFMPLVSSGPA